MVYCAIRYTYTYPVGVRPSTQPFLQFGSREVGAHVPARSVCVVTPFVSEEWTWTLRPSAILHRLLTWYHASYPHSYNCTHDATSG